MAADLIRYDLLVQDALRGAVRKVLSDVARDGVPGDHHFYISFRTHARGVRLSTRMRELYPDEMTIVLQHQFWDLSVTGEAFEVGLSFQNIPEMLLIPFDAVTRFADPSVGFELRFSVEDEAAGVSDTGTSPPRTAPMSDFGILGRGPAFAESQAGKANQESKRRGQGRGHGCKAAKRRTHSRLDRRLSQEELMGEVVNLRCAPASSARAARQRRTARPSGQNPGARRAEREATERARGLDEKRLDARRREVVGDHAEGTLARGCGKNRQTFA